MLYLNTRAQIIKYVTESLSKNAVDFEKNYNTSNFLKKAWIEIQTGIKYSTSNSENKTEAKPALYEKSLNG